MVRPIEFVRSELANLNSQALSLWGEPLTTEMIMEITEELIDDHKRNMVRERIKGWLPCDWQTILTALQPQQQPQLNGSKKKSSQQLAIEL